MKLAYGDNEIEYNFNSYTEVRVIEPLNTEPGIELQEAEQKSARLIKDALASPCGCLELKHLAEKKMARNAVIVVNDVTRPTPYQFLLPPLVGELNAAGISDDNVTLLVATGIHRPHLPEDNLFCYGQDMCQRLKIVNHNCDNHTLPAGILSNGLQLEINRLAFETDLLITTGLVSLHYIAGYSGGRKSILPGIAARSAIEASHKMMNDARACLANLEGNPVNDLMQEAASMAGVDFCVNVVGTHDRIEFAAAGNIVAAWEKAVEYCERVSVVTADNRADVVVASCGGYPKDINVYQAQKALDTAAMAVKPGGTIILLAECREGLGEEVFSQWIKSASCREDIVNRFREHFELGGHKAFAICRILERADILMVSSLGDTEVEELYIRPMPDLDQALQWAAGKHGTGMTLAVMPQAPRTAVKIKG